MTDNNRLVSVIVNNYNYGRFLGEAIDSALDQTYANMEVIVVDDGSTDNSRDVIARYGDRIIPLLKVNGGQASAFNAGFAASRGDVVIFLDADDVLLPTAVALALEQFGPGVAKVHWPLWRANDDLEKTGQQIPAEELPAGDFRASTFSDGPATSLSPPTSGNAWARHFLERVLPMPEPEHRVGADGYLYGLAPAFGTIGRVASPQAVYRVHGANNYHRMPVEERLRLGIRSFEQQWRLLEQHALEIGIPADRASWERRSYFHQLRAAIDEIEILIPAGSTLILLDEDRWALDGSLSGRTVLPFLNRNGEYWGTPENDASAIAELGLLRVEKKAEYLVIGWPGFWWLDYYPGFAAHLREMFSCIMKNDRLVAFDLTG
jgi:hypothetical protein